nr:serine/threonine-protein kinase STN7, chloroplastic [Tanacetum cinerariifolium]
MTTLSSSVVVKMHSLNSLPPSPFIGKKRSFKPLQEPNSRFTILRPNLNSNVIVASGIDFMHDVFLGVGVGLPCTVMECGDMIYRSTLPRSNALTLTIHGAVLALGILSYLWATPGVAPGFWDMFVLASVKRLFKPSYKKKLGEGAFSVIYRVSMAKNSSSKSSSSKKEPSIGSYGGSNGNQHMQI